MLTIENLTKLYAGGGRPALTGLSLTVPEGQLVALVGPSGAGKSTLVRCVNRLVEPTSGRILWRGLDLTSLGRGDLRRARRRIGMIFQEFALVERLTVMENTLSGRLGHLGLWRSLLGRFPAQDVERALELLTRLGLAEHVDRRADELSGGQRQRVGIARALMQTRELLLVDEPTANLDPKTARQILALLAELGREQGLTALINLHDLPLARQFADRIVGLRSGALVFDGPPSALDDTTLAGIYGADPWHGPPVAPAGQAS